MAETQLYGHIEIQRYLQHKMSPQEMHEFEKALMNDPFLADAMEGFSTSDPALAAEHLAEIERALLGGQQKAKVVPLPVQKTTWWRAAAIILVIVSAGAITYSVLNNNSAFNKNKKEIAASRPQPAITEKDSIPAVDKPLAQTDILPKKRLPASRKNGSPIIGQDEKQSATRQKEAAAVSAPPEDRRDSLVASSAAPSIPNNDLFFRQRVQFQRALPQNEFRGKIVDKEGEPLPFAAIKSANNSINTVADAKGNFSFKAPDSLVEVSVHSPGYATAKPKISNKTENKIVLNEDEELSLAEVVVTTLKKKNKNVTPTIQSDSSNAATPVGGWKNFQQYLSKQQDFIKGIESSQNLDDKLVLEFMIDKHGQPTDIKVPAELDKITAEKTIEIISNGPRWNNKKKDKKVKVVIAF